MKFFILSLFVLGRFISHYQSNSNESYQGNFHYQSSVCESIHMINHDINDKFFHGFLPIWALTLFGIAILFAVIFIAGLICHLSGCRKPTNHPHLSPVDQPLLVENNQLQIKSIKSEQLTQKSNDLSF